MNTGLRNAKGDLIAFIEQDDAWLLKKIEYQINLFKKNDSLFFWVDRGGFLITLIKEFSE